jgi:hypothetical protein
MIGCVAGLCARNWRDSAGYDGMLRAAEGCKGGLRKTEANCDGGCDGWGALSVACTICFGNRRFTEDLAIGEAPLLDSAGLVLLGLLSPG